MEKLTTNNTNIVLSENEKIKQAFQSKKINECSEMEIDIELSTAIDKAILFLGLNTHEQDRYAIKFMACDDVRGKFPLMAIKEISTAIELGVRGNYGEVFGIAPKDIYNWLNSYSISNSRRENQEKLQKEQSERIEPTDEDKAKIYWNNLVKAWHLYKEHGYYNDFGNSVYNTLLINEKINFTIEQKEDFKRIALINLKSIYNPTQHVGNVVKVNEARSILNEIESSSHNSRLIAEAKKIALNQFFKDLLDMDMNVEDLFAD